MENVYHIPAMLKETIEGLAIKPNGVYVDVTFGGGGHSRAILETLENSQITINNLQRACKSSVQNKGHLYSFDQDIEAYENAIKGEGEDRAFMHDAKWTFVHSNFRYLRNWMDYYGVKEIDGLLADLGVSFHHFDCPERGFSFRFSAPLDMRMNQTAKRTAADIVNTYSEEELAKVFWLYGELKNGRSIARNICKARSQKPILRTEELVGAAMGLPLAKLTGTEQGATQGEEEGNPPRLADVRELEIPTCQKGSGTAVSGVADRGERRDGGAERDVGGSEGSVETRRKDSDLDVPFVGGSVGEEFPAKRQFGGDDREGFLRE